VAAPARVTLATRQELSSALVDFSEYIRRVEEDYDSCDPPEALPRYLPLRMNLKKHFVPLECDGDYTGDLFAGIEEFLADPGVNHLTILGDFGTGKTSSMIELTARLLKRRNARLPLFFSLRDYWNVDSLQTLITKGLTEKYGVSSFQYPAFLRLLEEGRLLLIFDAFDEMASLSERWNTVESLRRLNEGVRPGSKVILTCRTHYFTSQAEEREQLPVGLVEGGPAAVARPARGRGRAVAEAGAPGPGQPGELLAAPRAVHLRHRRRARAARGQAGEGLLDRPDAGDERGLLPVPEGEGEPGRERR